MAFNEGEQVAYEKDGSRHSSVNGDNNSSIHTAPDSKVQKDELAVSLRGDTPKKGEHLMSLGQGNIEDQLRQLSTEEEKSWNYLDSVHSRNSGHAFGAKYLNDMNGYNGSKNGDDSFALDDSCASFASFGGTGDDSANLSDSAAELLSDQKEKFCNLEPEMTPRRKILGMPRQASSRMIRAPSYRGSNLQLIGEEDDL